MSKFSPVAIKKLYLKLIFNSMNGSCDSVFSQLNFDHAYFGEFLSLEIFARRGCLGGLCPGVLSRGCMS